MKWENSLKLTVLLLSLVCQIIAIFQYRILYAGSTDIPWADSQFYVLIFGSIGSTIALSLFKKGRVVFLILRSIIVVLIGIPFSSYIGIELGLITSIILEYYAYMPFPYEWLAGLSMIILSNITQLRIPAWDYFLERPSFHDLLSMTLFLLIILAMGSFLKHAFNVMVMAQDKSNALTRAVQQLSNANVGFQSYADRVVEKSTLDERNRITREIHDTIGYCLTNLTMMMEAAIKLLPEDEDSLRELLSEAKEEAKEGLQETRRALRILRNEERSHRLGLRAILRLTRAFEKATGVRVAMEIGDVPWQYNEEVELAIYRFVQESLTNALKHGNARFIKVMFSKLNDWIIIRVRDNGHGSGDVKKGIGFLGMEERIEQLRGYIRSSNVADGFIITAWIPWSTDMKQETHE